VPVQIGLAIEGYIILGKSLTQWILLRLGCVIGGNIEREKS
jgi:hypothetical protein